MNQVYSGLGFEMNHYNPSNPYVYNKTEKQAGKGNKLEELFTGIGRKTIDGHENNFYNDVLKGGSVLESGNSLYGKIDESKLDFCGNPIQYPYWKFDYKENKTVPRIEKVIEMTIGAGLTLEEIKVTTQTGIDARKKDKEKPCDSKCKAKEAERVGKTPKMNSNGEYIVLEELENSEIPSLRDYSGIKEGSNLNFMNAATIRSFGEDKGIDFNSDALAVERNGVGYIIYVDKKDYAEATKVFESAYNTNVVVKQKSDMSKNQKIEYAMVKGGVDYSGVDQLLGLFNIFSSQTANPCQYNCSGISYVNLTGDLSGMEGALTNGATNAKFSIGLPDFMSSIKEKGKEIKDNITGGKEQVVTDSNGNTYKVKSDANDFKSEINKSTGNSGGGNSLKPQDVNLSDFTQKGGKIDNFAEAIKGKNYKELETLFDNELVGNLGYVKEPIKSGDGIRYRLPNGKSILLEKGRPTFTDITHQGDYVKIPGTKEGTIRIPLEGNPALK